MIVDPANWARKPYYDFFSTYDNPFFGIVSELDVTQTYQYIRDNGIKFFPATLFLSSLVANSILNFRYRVVDQEIHLFDEIHTAATLARKDGSFGFSWISFTQQFDVFLRAYNAELSEVQNSIGIRANEDAYRADGIHYSSLPWIRFTGLSHARSFKTQDTVPKISFGKMEQVGRKRTLPISIEVHHGMMDGLHVAQFTERFQEALLAPQNHL
jgi:chloramphenicol O-acetyltransferase type A